MEDAAKLDPTSIEFCERRIEQLKSQKRKLEMTTTENFAEQADPKGGKKRCKEVKSLLERKVKNPETRQADQEDARKHAKQIGSLEKVIKFMEKRREYIIIAAERSISVEAAQELAEQEEELKDEEQPGGEWMQEYTRVQDLNAATDNLPTLTDGHKDPATVAAVLDPDDKSKIINVAKSVVKVSFPPPNRGREYLDQWYTGIIISWDVPNKTAMILSGGCLDRDIDDKSKRKIFVHYPYMEDDGLIEAKLLFFSTFYQLSLLEVAFQGMLLDVPTQIPHFGSTHPKRGDEVFSLGRDQWRRTDENRGPRRPIHGGRTPAWKRGPAICRGVRAKQGMASAIARHNRSSAPGRDKDLSLVVRRGTIVKDGCLIGLRQGYLFLDYELPGGGTGGPVVDHQGDVVGMVMACDDYIAIILPISIVLSCFRMWTDFRRIARPLLGMSCRNAEALDSRSGDIRFDALVVTKVDPTSAAWKQGIRSGNLIVSFDEQAPKPLPEFEVFLLSLGSKNLHGTHTEVDFKLEVQDPDNVQRSITLHVPFPDVANVLG
ncbi:uncharacterized protein LOC120664246 [Panicum virgatum]|uniref:PDZ domain-containing protein n=1 Tax=Panicum virgatum TaxID=38727 RepID=A0A8T0TWV4_PANVG|nr:uncharacterized protein LOC120664246 [Panicum virgatum]KAG2616652.1 hypothetical protein PVAP13_3NG249202 [Panicum virgatum]